MAKEDPHLVTAIFIISGLAVFLVMLAVTGDFVTAAVLGFFGSFPVGGILTALLYGTRDKVEEWNRWSAEHPWPKDRGLSTRAKFAQWKQPERGSLGEAAARLWIARRLVKGERLPDATTDPAAAERLVEKESQAFVASLKSRGPWARDPVVLEIEAHTFEHQYFELLLMEPLERRDVLARAMHAAESDASTDDSGDSHDQGS